MTTPQPPQHPSPENPACVITCAYYDPQNQRHDIHLDRISEELQCDNSFIWVGLYEPDATVLRKLQQEFGLHDLAIEDALKAHQRPKVENYDNTLFIVVNTAQLIGERICYGETHAFLSTRFLIIVRHGASLSYAPVRTRIERDPTMLGRGPAFCLYGVLDFIVDNYLPIMNECRDTLEQLEQDIFSENYQRQTVIRLYELKRELNKMRLIVAPSKTSSHTSHATPKHSCPKTSASTSATSSTMPSALTTPSTHYAKC